MRVLSRFKIPRDLRTAADMYYEIRAHRYGLQATIEKCREYEGQLRAHIIAAMPAGEPVVRGTLADIRLIPKIGVKVVSWDNLYEYIRRYAAWGILQRKVNDEAIKIIWATGEEVPGTEPVPYHDVSVVKH